MVIAALGAENAAYVYKFFSNDEVESITFDVSSLPYLDVATVDGVLGEFYELVNTTSTAGFPVFVLMSVGIPLPSSLTVIELSLLI